MNRILVFFVLLLMQSATPFAFAQAQKVKMDVWHLGDPAADGIFYLNTGQAERCMEPELWKRIKSDRKKAARADGDDFSLPLFEKDVELLANVYFVSGRPLQLAIVGGMSFAESERNVLSNIVALISGIVEESGGESVRSGTERNPVRNIRMKNEEEVGFGLEIEQVEDGFAKFRFLHGLEMPPKSAPAAPLRNSRAQALSKVKSGDVAIGIVLNPSAWSELFTGNSKDMKVMRRLFRAMETTDIRIRVEGQIVEVEIKGEFKSPVLAERYSKDLLEALPKVGQMLNGGILAELKPAISGFAVTISAKVRLDLAWESMMSMNANMSSANKNPQNDASAPTP